MLQQRLLEIAIAEFGARGLDGASTRGIAHAAGTAMSSITYHYGGKDGLYLAAADYVAAQIDEHMAPSIREGGIPEGTSPETARDLILQILDRFCDTMAARKSAAWSLFILREQMEPTEAFERIYGGLMGRMLGTLVELVGIATGRRDAQTAQIAVITLMGQAVSLRASRATVIRLLDRGDLDADAVALLKHRIAANTNAILDQLIAERQELP